MVTVIIHYKLNSPHFISLLILTSPPVKNIFVLTLFTGNGLVCRVGILNLSEGEKT